MFSVSQIWIIYEGNFTLMLTPLAVIRKLGLRHFYFITRNSLEIEMYKETECLRNYFITESIKADENEKSRQTMFSLLNFIPPNYIIYPIFVNFFCEKFTFPNTSARWYQLCFLSGLLDSWTNWNKVSHESIYTNRKCENGTFLQTHRFYDIYSTN